MVFDFFRITNKKIDDYLSELIDNNPPLIRLLTKRIDEQTDDVLGSVYHLISNEVIDDQELQNILMKANFLMNHRQLSKYQ